MTGVRKMGGSTSFVGKRSGLLGIYDVLYRVCDGNGNKYVIPRRER